MYKTILKRFLPRKRPVQQVPSSVIDAVNQSTAEAFVVAILTNQNDDLIEVLAEYKAATRDASFVLAMHLDQRTEEAPFADVSLNVMGLPVQAFTSYLLPLTLGLSKKPMARVVIGDARAADLAAALRSEVLPVMGWGDQGIATASAEALLGLGRVADRWVATGLAPILAFIDAMEFSLPYPDHTQISWHEDKRLGVSEFISELRNTSAHAYVQPRYHSIDTYELAEKILRTPEVVRRLPTIDARYSDNRLVMRTGGAHRHLRSMIQPLFTPKGLGVLEENIRTIVKGQLGKVAGHSSIDFDRDLSRPQNLAVLARFVGISVAELEETEGWNIKRLRRLDPGFPNIECFEIAFYRHLHEKAELWLNRRNPQKSSIIYLLHSSDLTDDSVRSDVGNLIVSVINAGLHATRIFLASVANHLAEHPSVFETLRESPEEIPAAVEEFLRYYSTAQELHWLFAAEDFECEGINFRKNDNIRVLLKKANRDPDVFENPDAFDWRANRKRHLAFGIGIHHCLGAWLVRTQAQILLEEWTTGPESIWPQNLRLED